MMIRWMILTIFLLQISSVKTIICYTCVDCGDPFNAYSPNVTQSPSSCYYCYKLTVSMAYVPTNYIVKECVQTCTESSGIFGGSSLEVNCCTTSLCNHALPRQIHGRLIGIIMSSFLFVWRNNL